MEKNCWSVLQVLVECVDACMTGEVDVQFGDIQRKEEKKIRSKKPENTILICSDISSFKWI